MCDGGVVSLRRIFAKSLARLCPRAVHSLDGHRQRVTATDYLAESVNGLLLVENQGLEELTKIGCGIFIGAQASIGDEGDAGVLHGDEGVVPSDTGGFLDDLRWLAPERGGGGGGG